MDSTASGRWPNVLNGTSPTVRGCLQNDVVSARHSGRETNTKVSSTGPAARRILVVRRFSPKGGNGERLQRPCRHRQHASTVAKGIGMAIDSHQGTPK